MIPTLCCSDAASARAAGRTAGRLPILTPVPSVAQRSDRCDPRRSPDPPAVARLPGRQGRRVIDIPPRRGHDLARSAYAVDFDEDFAGERLRADLWVDHYLPHWTTPDRSAARYTLGPDRLRLLVEVDQPAWRPEDGSMRVSNLQTGSFSGPRGSRLGQHRHRPDLDVRSP